MAYTITPYKRDGIGTISTVSSSTTITCNTDRGFRNVAVGGTVYNVGYQRTVLTKPDETTITVSPAVDISTPTVWEYLNPALVLTGYYYIKHTKDDKPTAWPRPTKDSDSLFAALGPGVTRDIIISGWIESSTIADVYKNVTILESLSDGSQTTQGTCTFAEDVPPRTSYVYIQSINWKYGNDKPKWLDVMINMIECKNRGST